MPTPNPAPQNPIRIVTAAALFDGHDATINVIRRVLQDLGVEVIHLGHNRSVREVVEAVVQEAAQGVCVSSYQGGHVAYFKYLRDALMDCGAGYVKIFGGGGGVIVHQEKAELEAYGITQIFHPDDGRRLGLEGMGRLVRAACDFDVNEAARAIARKPDAWPATSLGLAISAIEAGGDPARLDAELSAFRRRTGEAPRVLGVTGTGGAGKSSLVDELINRFKNADPAMKIGVVCVDPSKKRTGGALLGDRIRMNSLDRPGVFMRSQAARDSGSEISRSLPRVLDYLKQFQFDLLIAETSGIGQASSNIVELCDLSLYVMTAEFGAPSQLEKIDMIDLADVIAINKADRRGAADAAREVGKQFRRSRRAFDAAAPAPVYLTQASNFNDRGVNALAAVISEKLNLARKVTAVGGNDSRVLIPPERQNYLAEVTATVRRYKSETATRAGRASRLGALEAWRDELSPELESARQGLRAEFSPAELDEFAALTREYAAPHLEYGVRGARVTQPLRRESLGGIEIPRVALPNCTDWGDRWRYLRLENVPGRFPFTAGAFPLKREDEASARQFAGEGSPARTNRRFHYLSANDQAKRLSTAFDSVTLYGEDPAPRPDIFGKVGESGVSVATLDDVKALYAGFDLTDPATSVSMTINGPAPILLAFYLNAAIDQRRARHPGELSPEDDRRLVADTLARVRGTVQADILKEDQGQNTCIFSIDFALRLMADVQEYFVERGVKNFYSVSISGYHIAEAGANPVTQLALTLANAFTYLEYYLERGLKIDDFAPNLSFFFSNGLDVEYTVIGRVARRIWAIALRDRYHANERSQKLKYHIQTSGRSLHAQEIAFNDVRTTLQALVAITDQCNSLHTNAYDEAITTPTEESVRRAQAIQLIINQEFGLTRNENPWQGGYLTEHLTELVEEAVLEEFLRLNARGGVLGAMETQYQRGRIQDESLHYETLKHDGRLPIVGVNTFVDPKTLAAEYRPPAIAMARATTLEKTECLDRTEAYRGAHHAAAAAELTRLRTVAVEGGNVFAQLMSAARVCTLGQMTHALFEVGGRYRRNI